MHARQTDSSLPNSDHMNKHLLYFAVILMVCSCTKNNPTSPKAPADLLLSQENIVLNPTGFAPLSALLNYTYPSAGKTKITVFGKYGEHSTIQHVFNDYGLSHSVPITGLYAN